MHKLLDHERNVADHYIFDPEHMFENFGQGLYSSPAHALLELIDNSVDAKSSKIQIILLCSVDDRIDQICVVDNGCGMPSELIQSALQVGRGANRDGRIRGRLGRYGIGLPSSSLSQASRVDLFSWQAPGRVFSSFIDKSEVIRTRSPLIPDPITASLPPDIACIVGDVSHSGTAVLWSKLHLRWRTARHFIDASSELIGRTYREFLKGGLCVEFIKLNGTTNTKIMKQVLSIDPLHLIPSFSTPEPFDGKPMFEEFQTDWDGQVIIEGIAYNIGMRFSIAKNEARSADNAGKLPHGRFADRHHGISIVRAGREIELLKIGLQKSPTERWWSCEISFPAELDAIMEVTPDKQHARIFTDLLSKNPELEAEDAGYDSLANYIQALCKEGDPRAVLIQLSQKFHKVVRLLRDTLGRQTRGSRSKFTDESVVLRFATDAARKRSQNGKIANSEAMNKVSAEERRLQIRSCGFIGEKLTEADATEIEDFLQKTGSNFTVEYGPMDSTAFMGVETLSDLVGVRVNTRHPLHTTLFSSLSRDESSSKLPVAITFKIDRERSAVLLLLLSWARLEDEAGYDEQAKLQRIRQDWGVAAASFLENL